MLVLDKTNYMNYRICPRYGWHRFNKSTDFDEGIKEQLYQQGVEVETLAKELFPSGWEVSGERQIAAEKTAIMVAKPEVKVIYQATALSEDSLLAKADITTINDKQELHIYEVKMTNDVGVGPDSKDVKNRQEKYLYDIAFQKLAFENAGYKVGKVFLVHMNGNYCFKTEIVEPSKFFIQVDVSQEVEELLPNVKAEVEEAKTCYGGGEPVCNCQFKAKKKRCPGFTFFHPELAADDSIFNLSRISIQKIIPLYDQGVVKLGDITADISAAANFSQKQLNQISTHRTGQPIVNQQGIASILDKLRPPLSFLDYEAVNYPIPVFHGARPFQQVAFQFSLCILEDEQATEPIKHEHLLTVAKDEALREMIDKLKQVMPASGSIVVWHQGAERSFQNNLANLFPDEREFFEALNQRLFDLETIFSGQHYVHPGFKGKTSLKSVVPVLVSELDYSDLSINEGSQASRMWNQALTETSDNRQDIFANLLQYCHYDTLAMVRIYQRLKQLLAE